MKNGFKEVVDSILKSYGLRTRDCVGTVWADGDISWNILNAMGYRVEKGISNPDYDYVIISDGKSNLSNVFEALTKTKLGCIIIYRLDGHQSLAKDMLKFNESKSGINTHFWEYGDRKLLGVTFKGKEI